MTILIKTTLLIKYGPTYQFTSFVRIEDSELKNILEGSRTDDII